MAAARARRHSTEQPVTFLVSVGVFALGVVCIAWAGLGISSQQPVPERAESALASELTSFAVDHTATVRAVAAPDTATPYPVNGKKGETIGHLTIPVLKRKLPIIEGTGSAELKKGVGHFSDSVLPGQEDNCVLSGHRDTVFRGLGRLKKGDVFIVQTAAGKFTYEIRRIRIVDKEDRTVIVPTKNAVLTVTTCYPFNYVGNAPDRYILSADLVARE